MIRNVILALVGASLFMIWNDQPTPVKAVQVDYCVIDELAAGQDQAGVWHKFWSQGYGPCSLQDKFRDI